jgi:hypothetical protein
VPELEISRIHDAYAEGGECPICTVMSVADTAYVRSFRGGRVMAPEVRVATNSSGFCPDHYERLYRGEGKLGLALMVHTHLAQTLPALRRDMADAAEMAARPPPGVLGRLRRKSAGAASLASSLRGLVGRCFICDMLAKDLDRYCFTVLYLWQRDEAFPERLRDSRGFCLAHYAALLDKAETTLRQEELRRWLGDTVPLMTGSLERLEREILSFTQSYHHDARSGARTEEERTALVRALQKLAGRPMRLEKGLAPGPAEDQDQDKLS